VRLQTLQSTSVRRGGLQRKDRVDVIQSASMTGWLDKKGNRRWFVLRGGTLYWFVQQHDIKQLTIEFLQVVMMMMMMMCDV
jgi:hypothetical protein